ncbi:MAG: hypothetical protein ABH819_03465 [Patescibacteria group bacterium]
MNFYQVTVNADQVFVPEAIQNVVTKDASIDAWWHYLPNTFIIRTTNSAAYHSNRIINTFPGLTFFIVRIDLNENNGYLPKAAWDWINSHNKQKVKYQTNPLSPIYKNVLDNLPQLQNKITPSTLPDILDMLKKVNH